MKEKITNADKNHLRKLLNLNTPNLAKIWKIDNLDSHHPVVDLVGYVYYHVSHTARERKSTTFSFT